MIGHELLIGFAYVTRHDKSGAPFEIKADVPVADREGAYTLGWHMEPVLIGPSIRAPGGITCAPVAGPPAGSGLF